MRWCNANIPLHPGLGDCVVFLQFQLTQLLQRLLLLLPDRPLLLNQRQKLVVRCRLQAWDGVTTQSISFPTLEWSRASFSVFRRPFFCNASLRFSIFVF